MLIPFPIETSIIGEKLLRVLIFFAKMPGSTSAYSFSNKKHRNRIGCGAQRHYNISLNVLAC